MRTTILKLLFFLTMSGTTLAQSEVRLVEEKFKLTATEIKLVNDYIDQIRVGVSDSDSVEITVKVHMKDANGRLVNEKYDLNVSQSGGKCEINSRIRKMKAHYVFQKSGSDYDPNSKMYRADKALIIGTEMDIRIPRNVNFELETDMGEITIDYNRGGLLVSTYGNITVAVPKGVQGNFTMSSLYGMVMVDENLNFETERKAENGFVKVSEGKITNISFNGGGKDVSLTTFADIKIRIKE